MAIKTTLERLEQVQDAIELAEQAQATSLAEKSLQRANLATLYAQEDRLIKRYEAEQGTGGIPRINYALPKRLY